MDPVTRRRQVASWCARRFGDFKDIYDEVHASVWTGERFKDGIDDAAFAAAVTRAASGHQMAVKAKIVSDVEYRDVVLESTISGDGGSVAVGLKFGWGNDDGDGVWFPWNIVNAFVNTGRVEVSLNLEETSDWLRAPVPFTEDPVPDCIRNASAPDVGPVRETEVVAMITAILGTAVAAHVQRALEA